MLRQIFLVSFIALTTGAAVAGAGQSAADSCADAVACVDELTRHGRSHNARLEALERRLAGFGEAAVDALVARLQDGNADVSATAGMALGRFERIDPRHLPALIAAYRAGNEWLPRPIAATGSDEALAFLIAEFRANPDHSSNSALARFGEARLRPFVLADLEACRTSSNATLCRGVAEMLGELPVFPEWALEALAAVARSPNASEEVRRSAEYELIDRRHPHGLAVLMRDLEAARGSLPVAQSGDLHSPEADRRDSRIRFNIRDVGRFGDSAREAGPLLVWFLGRSDLPETRAAAALALGRIGDRSSAPALASLEPAFADDWLLAYNAVESIGRLRANEARSLLKRTSRRHWFAPVRNNAERALNVLRGGAFERPAVTRDGAPFEETDEPDTAIIYSGDLRYRGDRELPLWQAPGGGSSVSLRQHPVGGLRFPRSGTRRLTMRHPGEREVRPLAAGHPELARGDISAVFPTRDGVLVGYVRDDEGALFHFDERGGVRELVRDRVGFGFRLGGRLYFVMGSVHAMSTWGAVWEIDPAVPRIVRRIALPAHVYRAWVSSDRAIVLETGEGVLAINEDGSLADPAWIGSPEPDG